MERIRAGETGGIAVARLDRLSRAGVGGALKLVEEIQEHGGVLAAIDLGIDPTTVFGEFALTIMLALARMERRRITETWEEAQRRAVDRGIHIASRTPTGYVRRADGTLEPHPEWARVITEVFRRRAEGASWRALADLLNGAGVIGPYDSPYWRTRAVEHIIRNPVYLGEARSGRHRRAGAHEPLIDRATWEAAQVARGESVPRSEEGALLSGILRCAGCRYIMKPDKMTLRSGERVRTYRCRGEHAAGRCEARTAVLGSVIEPWVERRLFELLGERRAEALGAGLDTAELERELRDAEAELVAFRDDERIVGALGPDRFVEGLELRAARVDDAQSAMTEAAQSHGMLGVPDEAVLREPVARPVRRRAPVDSRRRLRGDRATPRAGALDRRPGARPAAREGARRPSPKGSPLSPAPLHVARRAAIRRRGSAGAGRLGRRARRPPRPRGSRRDVPEVGRDGGGLFLVASVPLSCSSIPATRRPPLGEDRIRDHQRLPSRPAGSTCCCSRHLRR